MTSKRDKICAEILQVESNYVQALNTGARYSSSVMELFGLASQVEFYIRKYKII